MKKFIHLSLIAIAGMAVGCHKDAAVTTLAPIGFKGSLTASTTSVKLAATNDSTAVLTLNWPAVVYPAKGHVTYTLQADATTDTTGATAWTKATSILVGNDILTKTFKGADLNKIALGLGITANDTGKMVFRVQSYQDRNAFSKPMTITVSPWAPIVVNTYSHNYPVLYVPGEYQGWSPPTAPVVAAEVTNIYEGYIYEPSTPTATYQFKFTSAPDWNHINYGDSTATTLTTNGNAAGMTLPGTGYYELVVNPVALTWNYTKVTWAIIGDATPNGWGTETEMTFDPIKQVYTITLNMVSTGSFKFRANNAWNLDFGLDPTTNKLAYADNPAYPYNGTLNNLSVPTSGNYTITLDLHNANDYEYTLKKN